MNQSGDLEARLTHRIDQSVAGLEEKISSLEDAMTRKLCKLELMQARNTSTVYAIIHGLINPALSKSSSKAHKEITGLAREYLRKAEEAPMDELSGLWLEFTRGVNRITRAAGLGEIWIE